MELNAFEKQRGYDQAIADVAANRFQLYWQTRGAWGALLTKLMADRFGVAVHHTSDMTTLEEVSYQAGYNEAVAIQLDRLHGEGAFASILDEVAIYREQGSRDQ